MNGAIYWNFLYISDKTEIKFGQKNGSVDGINQYTDGNRSWSNRYLQADIWKKISFFKYLCEVLLRNSGVPQGNYHYTITV